MQDFMFLKLDMSKTSLHHMIPKKKKKSLKQNNYTNTNTNPNRSNN